MMVRINGLVLHGFYRMRAAPFYTPRLGDFGHCVSFEDIFSGCESLARHGLLDWKTIPGVGAASFGTGRITPLGIEVVEGRSASSLPMLLPHPEAPIMRCDMAIPDISRQLHEISHALDRCQAHSADVAEARRRLAQLTEHPLVAAMGRIGSPL